MPGDRERITKSQAEAKLPPSEWDALVAPGPSDPSFFEGERNINDATGKERTYSEMDLYPRMAGESKEEYGERIKKMHKQTEKYLEDEEYKKGVLNEKGERNEVYLKSEHGKKELEAEDAYARVHEKLSNLVKNGIITEARAKDLEKLQLGITDEAIEAARADYNDSRAVGTPEEHRAYRDWLKKHDAENRTNLANREEDETSDDEKDTDLKNPADKPDTDKPDTDKPDTDKPDKIDATTEKGETDADKPDSDKKDSDKDNTDKDSTDKDGADKTDKDKSDKDSDNPDESDKPDKDADKSDKENPTTKDGSPDPRTAEGLGKAADAAKEKLVELEKQKEAILAREKEYAHLSEAELKAKLAQTEAVIKTMKKAIELYMANQREIERTRKEIIDKPLIAINANFTADKRDLAHDIAERELNEELSKAGFIKKLWKGNARKIFYETRYANQLLNGDRTINIDGKEFTLDELMAGRSEAAITRFVMSVTEDNEAFIHSKAGERRMEADSETTEKIKSAIFNLAQAASKELPDDIGMEDARLEFHNRIAALKGESHDKGDGTDELLFDNYEYVALQAFYRIRSHVAEERVMEGFKVYNAEVRDGIRTETHRNAVDRLINKMESRGLFVGAEVIALAAGSFWALTRSGTSALAGAGAGVGIASAIAGVREGIRITEDRTRMQRDIANGLTYNNKSRYEQFLYGTRYKAKKATDIIADLETAKTKGGDELLNAMAKARARIDFSDTEGKDLIIYSSEDARGDERLKLDIALIEAEKLLTDKGRRKYELAVKKVNDMITESVDEKDSQFKRKRLARSVAKAGKSLLLGSAVFLGSQEVMAAMDQGKIGILEKYGVFEKLGINVKENTEENASETLLASGFGLNRGHLKATDTIRVENSENYAEAIENYRNNGFTEVEVQAPSVETTTELVEISNPSEAVNRVKGICDGYANNGTAYSDGNELSLHIGNGRLTSTAHGISTMGKKQFNIDELAANNQIKGFVTLRGNTFEVAYDGTGWGENGILTTTSGDIIKGAFTSSGAPTYDSFQIVIDQGVDDNGFTHFIPVATHLGSGTFNGTISQVVEVPHEIPGILEFVTTYVSDIPRAINTEGVAFTPLTGRQGLGGPNAPAPVETATPRRATTPSGARPAPRVSSTSRRTASRPATPTATPTAATAAPAGTPETAPSSTPTATPEATTTATPEAAPTAEPIFTSSSEAPTGTTETEAPNPAEFEVEDPSEALFREALAACPGLPGDVLEFLRRPNGSGDAGTASERHKKYAEWWGRQSDSTKNLVARFIKYIMKADNDSITKKGHVISKFGAEFMNWTRSNHGELFK